MIGKFRLHEKRISFYIGEKDFKLRYADSYEPRIYIANGLNETLTAMQLFGRSFKRIHYDVAVFGTPSSLDIFEYGDKYCSQATKEITIRRINGKALAKRSFTFDNTTAQIAIHGHIIDSFPLNEYFPFMQQLTVSNLVESIVHHYPHLTKCRIQSPFQNLDHANPNVYELIRLNPQMRELSTRMENSASYLKYLSDMLPHLETLSIILNTNGGIDLAHEIMHFKSIKEFSLYILSSFGEPELRPIIGNIQFDQLEVFKLEATWPVFADNELIQLIAANRGLKKIQTNLQMTIGTFNSLVEVLPELNEISIRWHDEMIESLAAFFMGNGKINRINFHDCYQIHVDDLQGDIPPNWEIVEIPLDTISVIRK